MKFIAVLLEVHTQIQEDHNKNVEIIIEKYTGGQCVRPLYFDALNINSV